MELELKELTQKPTPTWVHPEFQEYSFGCLATESRTMHFTAEIPAELGPHTTSIPIESTAGLIDLPVRVQVAPRLLFAQANVSVGSVEELAKASSRFWEEARLLWADGRVREWLHRGLMRFDLVDIADQLGGDPSVSFDMQFVRFMLQVCPDCRQWLPAYLQACEDSVDLGLTLNRTLPHHLRIDNLGGGEPSQLTIVACPSWLSTHIITAEPSGITLELVGNTHSLPRTGSFEEVLVLEWAGSYGGTELAPQRLTIPVGIEVIDSLNAGRWRIPFDGEAQVRGRVISVRTLWVCGIGLAAFAVGILAGILFKNALWTILILSVLWLAGSVLWAIHGLGYRDYGSVLQDTLVWLKKTIAEVRQMAKDRRG